ncbi:MAG: sugar transferase [Bacteroidales bacterium]|nr:sugar transferase [Bacteroidales bacterium]
MNRKERQKIITRKTIYILIDVLIIFGSFLLFVWIKPATKRFYIPTYITPLFFFETVWVLVSLFISKYDFHKARKVKDVIVPIIIANVTITAVVITLIYSFGAFSYSRLIVYGTILLTTLLEIFISYFYFSYKKPVIVPDFEEISPGRPVIFTTDQTLALDQEELAKQIENREQVKKIIIQESGEEVYKFISEYADVGHPQSLLVSTRNKFNIEKLPAEKYFSIINLHRVNDFGRINKFFETVNDKLPMGGQFIGNAETYMLRKEKILKKYPVIINRIIYFFDFVFTRVIPKLPVTKNIYFYITLGQNRVVSRAETLGRLYSCGFEVAEERFLNNMLYFVARKVKKPAYDLNPTYGPFVRLRRMGKGGKIIGVYKLRTMHAYSEYLQEYVYEKHKLGEGGKFKNDFRVTALGRLLRKFWLDELPMFINLLKGEMKLVGVRPISRHYYNLYSEELKEKRILHKPGLIPPFYVDLPKTLEEIMASELKYLNAYEKNPFSTDLKYFFRAFFNIVFRNARSK